MLLLRGNSGFVDVVASNISSVVKDLAFALCLSAESLVVPGDDDSRFEISLADVLSFDVSFICFSRPRPSNHAYDDKGDVGDHDTRVGTGDSIALDFVSVPTVHETRRCLGNVEVARIVRPQ